MSCVAVVLREQHKGSVSGTVIGVDCTSFGPAPGCHFVWVDQNFDDIEPPSPKLVELALSDLVPSLEVIREAMTVRDDLKEPGVCGGGVPAEGDFG